MDVSRTCMTLEASLMIHLSLGKTGAGFVAHFAFPKLALLTLGSPAIA